MRKVFILFLSLLIVVLAGCAHQTQPATDKPNSNTELKNEMPEAYPLSTNGIDEELFAFLENDCSYKNKNYIFSPLSYKYAILLATSGAEGDTQTELLKSMNFNSLDEYLVWAQNANNMLIEFEKDATDDFNSYKKYNPSLKEPNRKLSVANSIWHNTDATGLLREDYIEYSKKNFNSDSINIKGDKLMPEINKWVSEKTNGLIPTLFNTPLDDKNTILINALYLKSPWSTQFNEYATSKSTFYGLNENKEIDFMENTENYEVYKDDKTTLVIVTLEGGINCAFVMGDTNNLFENIEKSKTQYANLSIPKFEIETSFDNKELVNFLSQKGVNLALDAEKADFSNLISDSEIFIEDIVQKAKIITNEDGIEAAAVTAIMMDNSASFEPNEPVNITFDKPFRFFIYNENANNELLFFGNYCNP